MKGNCERCELPRIKEGIDGYRNAVEAANANIQASGSPTEAKPYKEHAQSSLKELRKLQNEMAVFLSNFAGWCDDCEWGA